MNDNDTSINVYRISYIDNKNKCDQEVFSDSVERAKNRFEKFKQEHKNYKEIKLQMLPSSPNTIFEPLQNNN